MCGRLACTLENSAVSKACEYKDKAGNRRSTHWQAHETGDGRGYSPSYNIAPTDVTLCIVAGRHFKSAKNRVLHPMIWGMIPRWHKGDYRKHGMATHNARFEGLATSKLYSQPLSLGQRCVIICEGYYEWKSTGRIAKSAKQPYFVYAKQDAGVRIEDRQTWREGIKLLKLAGIFDSWSSAEGKKIFSCTMITKEANDVLSWIHHRVPVFLDSDEEVADWLDYENIPMKEAVENLHGPTEDSLQWHPVDPMMNNSSFKEATCYQPIVLKEKKTAAAQSGLMDAWLKTGSIRRKVPENDERNCKSEPKRSKPE